MTDQNKKDQAIWLFLCKKKNYINPKKSVIS